MKIFLITESVDFRSLCESICRRLEHEVDIAADEEEIRAKLTDILAADAIIADCSSNVGYISVLSSIIPQSEADKPILLVPKPGSKIESKSLQVITERFTKVVEPGEKELIDEIELFLLITAVKDPRNRLN